MRAPYAVTGPDFDGEGFVRPRPEHFRFATEDEALIEARELHDQFGDVFIVWNARCEAVGRFPKEFLPCVCHSEKSVRNEWVCIRCGRTKLPLFRDVRGIVTCYVCRVEMKNPLIGKGRDYVPPEALQPRDGWRVVGLPDRFTWAEIQRILAHDGPHEVLTRDVRAPSESL